MKCPSSSQKIFFWKLTPTIILIPMKGEALANVTHLNYQIILYIYMNMGQCIKALSKMCGSMKLSSLDDMSVSCLAFMFTNDGPFTKPGVSILILSNIPSPPWLSGTRSVCCVQPGVVSLLCWLYLGWPVHWLVRFDRATKMKGSTFI